ncbi:MAG: hypothetical protein ACPG05_02535 [Bdellovibrionales bacterium]
MSAFVKTGLKTGLGTLAVLAMTACTMNPTNATQSGVTHSTVDSAATQQENLVSQYRSDKFDPDNAKGEHPDPKRDMFSFHTSGVPYWMSDRAVRVLDIKRAVENGTPAIDLFLGELGSRADRVRRRGNFGYGYGYYYHYSIFGRDSHVTDDNFTETSLVYKSSPKWAQNQIKQHMRAFFEERLTRGPIDVITQQGQGGDIHIRIDSGDDRGYKFTQLRKLHMQGYQPGNIASNFGTLPWDNGTLNQWRNMCADTRGTDATVDYNPQTESISYSCVGEGPAFVRPEPEVNLCQSEVGNAFYTCAAEATGKPEEHIRIFANQCFGRGGDPVLYQSEELQMFGKKTVAKISCNTL